MTAERTTSPPTPSVQPLSHVEWQTLVAAACAAPSVLNTQPWSFDVHANTIELYADATRELHWSVDPHGRQLVISCGAALFNLRVAAAHLGRDVTIDTFPDHKRRDLLATATLGLRGRPHNADADLFPEIRRRHTHRHPFGPRAIPGSVLGELTQAIRSEHCAIATIGRAERMWLFDLIAFAEVALAESPGYADDLAKWTGGTERRDGVPISAFGPVSTTASPPMRDFGLGHMYAQQRDDFGYDPWIAILATAGDDEADWLRAGQALQRLLLTATARGLTASFLNQPLDDPSIRRDLTARSLGGHPQMILRLGYSTRDVATPRRRIDEVMRPQRGVAPGSR